MLLLVLLVCSVAAARVRVSDDATMDALVARISALKSRVSSTTVRLQSLSTAVEKQNQRLSHIEDLLDTIAITGSVSHATDMSEVDGGVCSCNSFNSSVTIESRSGHYASLNIGTPSTGY